jgi:hypothetical protein
VSEGPTPEAIKSLFERLASAPRRFFELCSGADERRMAASLGPGKWSPLQILRHLEGCDREALLPRIERILAEDDPFLPAWDQDLWMKHHGHVNHLRAVLLLDEWARLREKIAVTLFDLDVEAWRRTGRHEVRGQLSLYELCRYFADHDDSHYRQIEQHLGRDSALN